MNDSEKSVVLSQAEIDQLLVWIKEGKTLKQIAELILQLPTTSKRTRNKRVNVKSNIKNEPNNINIQNSQYQFVPSVFMSIECTFNNKKITIGATEQLISDNLIKAHEELYFKLLKSLDNLISLH